jgi:hypothetical protein
MGRKPGGWAFKVSLIRHEGSEMMDGTHYRGFEKEEMFIRVWRAAARNCPGLSVSAFCRMIRNVAPDFLNDLFSVRPCVRRLRYVRHGHNGLRHAVSQGYFVPGRVYESIDFNGGDYAIKGYVDGRIGHSCFEVVKE